MVAGNVGNKFELIEDLYERHIYISANEILNEYVYRKKFGLTKAEYDAEPEFNKLMMNLAMSAESQYKEDTLKENG